MVLAVVVVEFVGKASVWILLEHVEDGDEDRLSQHLVLCHHHVLVL